MILENPTLITFKRRYTAGDLNVGENLIYDKNNFIYCTERYNNLYVKAGMARVDFMPAAEYNREWSINNPLWEDPTRFCGIITRLTPDEGEVAIDTTTKEGKYIVTTNRYNEFRLYMNCLCGVESGIAYIYDIRGFHLVYEGR